MTESTTTDGGIEISIIVPVYNVALYIEECLESLEQQSFVLTLAHGPWGHDLPGSIPRLFGGRALWSLAWSSWPAGGSHKNG